MLVAYDSRLVLPLAHPQALPGRRAGSRRFRSPRFSSRRFAGVGSAAVGSWNNWAGNQSATTEIVHPVGTPAISQAVTSAHKIKPIGSGHSFTGIGRPEHTQLVLDRHAGLVSIDVAAGLVTVQAGMTLRRLNALLEHAGLSMTNLGDIDAQTVAGALSTGTHGTGARFGGLATQLRAFELVLADGSVLTCSQQQNSEIFRVGRVGLGALGVLSSVTLQVEPLFGLSAVEAPMELAEVLARFDEFADATDHFEFYWFPHTERTLTKRNTRVATDELAPLPGWRTWWDDEFLSNTVFGAVVSGGRRQPRLVRPLSQLAGHALGRRTFTDVSHRVFVSARRVRFVEMEYALPRAAAVDVVAEIKATIERRGWRIAFPIEVRVAAADDIALSTASDRDSAYVAVHMPVGTDHEPYFRAVEAIAGQVGGRPHWGKLHYLDRDTLATRYPQFEQFVELRERLDPGRVFTNTYLDSVLGA
jgi:FAD-linked oxidoreductase